MPKERKSYASPRAKPYDRKPRKPPPVQLSAHPSTRSPGGGLTRSTSLFGSIARLVSNPLGWLLRGEDDGVRGGGREMPIEEDEAGENDEALIHFAVENGPPKGQTKRRQSDGAPDDKRRKRLRVNSPPRAGPSGAGYLDVPDLATSFAKKREPARRKQTSAELMPPPPPPVITPYEPYDPRYQRSSSRDESMDVESHNRSTSIRQDHSDMLGSRMDISTTHPPAATRFGLTPRTPFERSSSLHLPRTSLRSPTSKRAGDRREPSVSDRMSDVMSVEAPRYPREERLARLPSYTAPVHRPPVSRMSGHTAEEVLRALETYKSPLSNSRAPVLPAARINVPIPDKYKGGYVNPYARPRRRVAETAGPSKSRDAMPDAAAKKSVKGKEKAAVEEEKDTDMMTDDVEPQKELPKTAEVPVSAAPSEPKKAESAPEPKIQDTPTFGKPAVPATALPIPSGPIPKVDIPIISTPALTDTGFKVVDSYDTKGKSSLRVGKQAITRHHEAAAGGDRKKAERQTTEAARPAKKGTNVFRLPDDDDDDEDIAEKPELKASTSTLDPKTVAEWFKPPVEPESAMEVSVKPVVEQKDFFKDSLARLGKKASPLPTMPALFGAASNPASTSLVFNANIASAQPTIQFGAPKSAAESKPPVLGTGPSPFQLAPPKPAEKAAEPRSAPVFGAGPSPFQPTVQFGAPKPADSQPKISPPALGTGPSPFDAILKASLAPSTPPAEAPKSVEAPKPSIPSAFSFGAVKPAEPSTAPSITPAKPAFGSGSFAFGAPATKSADSAAAAPASTAFSFGKPAGATTNGPSAFSFGAAPSSTLSFGSAPTSKPAEEPTKATPSFSADTSAFKMFSKSAIAPVTTTTPATTTNPASATASNEPEASKPAAPSLPAFGSAAAAFSFGPKPGEASRPLAFGAAAPSWNAFGGQPKETKPEAEESKEAPKPPALAFGGFGTAFGSTTDSAAPKPAFGGFGNGDSKPAALFGATTPSVLTPTTPAPALAPADAVRPKTPPAKESSPDKMETSPVRENKITPIAAPTTTPAGVPSSKPIFPSFGSTTPSTNLFGTGGFGSTTSTTPAAKDTAAPANPFGAPAASGSGFSFSFGGSSTPGANPFAGAGGGASPFGNPFAKPASDAPATNGTTPTFGAPAAIGTPERPQSSGFSFGAPATGSFSFGAGAQPSPFGGSSTGLPSGTPPLAFGAPAPSGDGPGTPGVSSPAIGGGFNFGAADNTRKVRGLPSRRKRA